MERRWEGKKEETRKAQKWNLRVDLPWTSTCIRCLKKTDLESEGKDFLMHQKEMLIAMSGTHKKVLWVEVILPTAGRQNEWILCWGPYSIWIHFICACPLSSGHVERGAVADGLFQETTGPKGIPLCCAFSPQTTKAGCGQHTLVKGAKIVSAGCPTDCRQAEERAEQKLTCQGEKNTLLLLEWGVQK